MKNLFAALCLFFVIGAAATAAVSPPQENENPFSVRGFHLDLRVQVMTIDALKTFALRLKKNGINTLIMEWEGTYPFEKHPLIPNRYAYTKEQIISFIKYCDNLGIDVIPLQQSFGHVEYILRNTKYMNLRESQTDYSQVCPLEVEGNTLLFTDLYTELVSTHTSKYIHIGGDETRLLGHDEKCRLKLAKEGKSKLYVDYLKTLCNIVIKLGKRPVIWADIALAYPDAIKSLPKETIFVDWNYGWELDRFGNHQKLMESGFEIWGAPALRSYPDNYNLTLWEKHFQNIRDFVPAARALGYKGIVMTSWSTSGNYSPVYESEADIAELYAIRHVYPLAGFNILIEAFGEGFKSHQTLNIEEFIQKYCKEHFGFSQEQSDVFWKALKTSPYDIQQGKVIAPSSMTVQQLTDSNRQAVKALRTLIPLKNQLEFEHFKLMADIRDFYLRYQSIEKLINDSGFTDVERPAVIGRLKELVAVSKNLDRRFNQLNKNFLTPAGIDEENQIRNIKVNNLNERLSRKIEVEKNLQ